MNERSILGVTQYRKVITYFIDSGKITAKLRYEPLPSPLTSKLKVRVYLYNQKTKSVSYIGELYQAKVSIRHKF